VPPCQKHIDLYGRRCRLWLPPRMVPLGLQECTRQCQQQRSLSALVLLLKSWHKVTLDASSISGGLVLHVLLPQVVREKIFCRLSAKAWRQMAGCMFHRVVRQRLRKRNLRPCCLSNTRSGRWRFCSNGFRRMRSGRLLRLNFSHFNTRASDRNALRHNVSDVRSLCAA
jgi:hypothetical protein